jgi:hypothetical protein
LRRWKSHLPLDGRSVAWAGSWDLVVRPQLYLSRTAAATARDWRGRSQRANGLPAARTLDVLERA